MLACAFGTMAVAPVLGVRVTTVPEPRVSVGAPLFVETTRLRLGLFCGKHTFALSPEPQVLSAPILGPQLKRTTHRKYRRARVIYGAQGTFLVSRVTIHDAKAKEEVGTGRPGCCVSGHGSEQQAETWSVIKGFASGFIS